MTLRKSGRIFLIWLGCLFIVACVVAYVTRGPAQKTLRIHSIGEPSNTTSKLVVMTLNLAHGRSDGFHHALQSTEKIRGNLKKISSLIAREAPDIIAVQEADGPSFWSGVFDHVGEVAKDAQYPHWIRGTHVDGFKVRYGTGLISRFELSNAESFTFEASPPTFSKGFVIATVPHPQLEYGLDVVSVHLDFARSGVRESQLEELVRQVNLRGRPVVIMGDFNSEWEDDLLPNFARALNLSTWQPTTPLNTFRSMPARLDWIFVSDGFRVENMRVLDDVVSDHRAVIAQIVEEE